MKRIIAVMVALMFAAVLFNINVSAMTKQEYEQQYLSLLSDYQHGYITFDEFQQYEEELTARFTDSNTDSDGVISSIAQNVSNTVHSVTAGIGNAVSAVGESVKDWIDDVLNPYATTESVPDVDMQGYGVLIRHTIKNANIYREAYGSFAYVIDYVSSSSYKLDLIGPFTVDWYQLDGTYSKTETYDGVAHYGGHFVHDGGNCIVEVYGDVRYSDGTQADGIATDLTYTDKPIYDFTNATDSELDSILNNLNETLKRENPDLSTMEGLLESIYFRLGKLDSDNDNALLSDINKAILALSNSNDENAAEIIIALGEIKDEINNMSGDINDNLDDLENNFDKIVDFEIPVELFNVDFDSLSDEIKDKVDDIVELTTTLIAKGVPMAAINGGLIFYQNIVFSSSNPKDISFDLTFNGEQYTFTILSTSFFGSEGAQALQIIKNFVAVVLGYAWVLAMRKKAVNMM